MKKIFTILLAVALVLSFSVVATPVSADQWAELTTNITAPANGVGIVGGREFTVSANVTNYGNAQAQNVTATIRIGGNAILKSVAGNVATRSIATLLAANATAAVNWTLVCTGEGNVSINVTPSGIDWVTGGLIVGSRLHSNTVIISQQKILQVNIVAPKDGDAFNLTQVFEVTANVTNISSLNATYVKLTISIDRCAAPKAGEVLTRTVGPLGSNVTASNFTWTLTCTGDGFSRITVSPSGNVANEVGEPTPIPTDALTPATVTISQGVFNQTSIGLVKGWNLISLPLIPLDSAINATLAGILDSIISVWYWDAATAQWKSFAPGAPSSLLTMEDGKAYWINMKALRTLQLAGTPMPKGAQLPRAYNVVVGWNMVGFKNTAYNVTAADYLAGTEYVRIYGFNTGAWFTIPGPAYNTTMMVPGLGYWVAFTKPGTIYP